MAQPFCTPDSNNFAKWTTWDFVKWKALPNVWGGGDLSLIEYKDSWIIYNRHRIISIATQNKIPPILLASVAWSEVGGKPDGVKRYVHTWRTYNHSGPSWVQGYIPVEYPRKTSAGAVSIQLRVVIKELGINPDQVSYSEEQALISCLETDVFNLNIVAKHLRGVIRYDYPSANSEDLTEEQFIVAGARYNRGIERKLSDITNSLKQSPNSPGREFSDYGRSLLRNKEHVMRLLYKK